MNTRALNRCARHVIASVLVIMSASAAFAADPPATSQPAPSKEMREKMASLHEQMAACLRSDKPISDCHSQMMKNCRETLGDQGCPHRRAARALHCLEPFQLSPVSKIDDAAFDVYRTHGPFSE